jgi:YD repeat-containing protein
VASVTTTGGGVIGYQYDANGNHTRLTWNDGYFVTYAYDALNRMTDVKQSGTSSLAHYSYDTLSRRTGITYGVNSTAAHAYNVNDDMASVTHGFTGGPVTLSYTYNKVHQITNMTVSDNNYLRPRPSSAYTDTYTSNNMNQYTNLSGDTSFTYDNNGNLSGLDGNTYTYDTENRLVGATVSGTTMSLSKN